MERYKEFIADKKALLIVLATIIIGVAGYFAFGKNVTVKATLGGDVTAVCAVGTKVSEGDVLVRVKGLTGEAVAARATADGEVIEVRVQKGTKIIPKAAVAVIKRK